MSKTELPEFASIQTQLFPFMHDRLTKLHGWAAQRSVSLLRQRTKADVDLDVVHVGAGFGADMQEAYQQGIKNSMGLEKDPLQVTLAEFLRKVNAQQLIDALCSDVVVSTLYCRLDIVKVANEYCRSRDLYNREPLAIYQCDVREFWSQWDLAKRVGKLQGRFDGMIGNIMMHWLVQGGFLLSSALEMLSELLKEGGYAVFSVPFHFTPLEDLKLDEILRRQCVLDTTFYREFTDKVVSKLKVEFGDITSDSFRKVPGLLLREADINLGSKHMKLISSTREWYEPNVSIECATLGIGTFESSFRARQPAAVVAPFVSRAVDETALKFGTDYTTGTFVSYYVYQKQ